MTSIFDSLKDKIYHWWEGFVLMLPNIAVAVLVVAGFVFIARYSKKLLLNLLNRLSSNTAVNRLLANALTVVVVIVGLFIALGILDLNKTVTSLLAGAGVVGLAIGLAFQDPILNVISGVILSVRDVPFKLGDLIRTNGHYGYVDRISLRSTIIKSLSGEDIVLPNKMVVQDAIVNYSFTEKRRVDIFCGVAYNSDLDHVEKTALKAIEENTERIEGTEIEFMYTEFADSSINFTLRYWIQETGEKDFLNSRSKSIVSIKKAFDKEGIAIPFPIRTLEFSQKEFLEGIKSSA